MKPKIPLFTALCLLIPALPSAQPRTEAPEPPPRYSGPYTHQNLSVLLIHGPDRLQGQDILTLSEAMKKKKLIVHETGDVNELAIENRGKIPVFVHAGDIVRGGQQDRVLAVDMIVPPRSKKIPIESFCVEQGRWNRRGGESVRRFEASDNMVSGKKMKIATKQRRSQREVWDNVAETQSKLRRKLKGDVQDARSASSLELTRQNRRVKRAQAGYLSQLKGIVNGKPDVVGYVFSVNGAPSAADIYASPRLFQKLWPKLLDAAVVEALAEQEDGPTAPQVPAQAAFKNFLDVRKEGKVARTEKGNGYTLELVTRKQGKRVVFDSNDAQGRWIHQSYVVEDDAPPTRPTRRRAPRQRRR